MAGQGPPDHFKGRVAQFALLGFGRDQVEAAPIVANIKGVSVKRDECVQLSLPEIADASRYAFLDDVIVAAVATPALAVAAGKLRRGEHLDDAYREFEVE